MQQGWATCSRRSILPAAPDYLTLDVASHDGWFLAPPVLVPGWDWQNPAYGGHSQSRAHLLSLGLAFHFCKGLVAHQEFFLILHSTRHGFAPEPQRRALRFSQCGRKRLSASCPTSRSQNCVASAGLLALRLRAAEASVPGATLRAGGLCTTLQVGGAVFPIGLCCLLDPKRPMGWKMSLSFTVDGFLGVSQTTES